MNLIGDKQGNAPVTEIKWTLVSRPSGAVNQTLGTSSTVPYTLTVGPTTLNVAGDYVFQFSFKLGGALKTKTVNVRVNGPTFTITPAAATTYCHNVVPAPLSVVATGAGTLTYQWYVNTVNSNTGGTLISGETASFYTPPTNTLGTLYYYVVVTADCGAATSNTAQVTVNPSTATVTAHPSSAGYCQNTTAAALTVAGNNVTGYQWYRSATATGPGILIDGATSASYVPPTATVGTVYYYALLQGSCGATPSNHAAVTVSAAPSAASAVTNTAGPVCSASAAVFNLTGQAGSTVTYNINGGTNQTVVLTGGAATVTVPSATVNQTLNMVSVTNGGCTLSLGTSATVTVGQTTVYNSGWSIQPTATNNLSAEIRSDYTSTGDLNVCSLLVTNNAPVTINAGHILKVQNGITVATGSLTVASDAGVIQVNDLAVNTGNINVYRNANLKRLDYNYWASPVSGQNLKSFSPGTLNNRFYTYKEADDTFEMIDPLTNSFSDQGKGYAIRAANTLSTTTTSQPFVFTGKPNNGLRSTPLAFSNAAHGYNLVGNPYPSAINFYDLYTDNSALIYNTAYFWTNVNPNPAMQGSGYPGTGYLNNYAVLNGTGGIGATSTTADNDSRVPNEFIKVGQGFIVKAKQAGNLQYRNSIRTGNTSGVFFNRSSKPGADQQKDRFWLKLTTPMNVVTTALIGYIENAADGYDADYDADLFGLGADALFTTLQEKRLGIQGRAYPIKITDVVPLGTSHYEAGNYTLSLGSREGIFGNGQAVYLKDRQTGTVTNLSEGSYTFAANAGISEGRFEIVYVRESVLVTDDSTKEELVIYRDGTDFILRAQSKKITGVEVYDTAGRLIGSFSPNSTTAVLPAERMLNGVYILKIDQNGKVSSRKIIK